MTRRVAKSSDGAATQPQEQLRRAKAYKALFSGNSTREDGEIVLSHLCKRFEFFEPPTLESWIAKTGSPAGYELNCALHAARAEPIRVILNHIDIGDDFMMALEKAAQS